MNRNELLRSLPSVDELMKLDDLSELRSSCAHSVFVDWIRNAIEHERARILSDTGGSSDTPHSVQRIVKEIRSSHSRDQSHRIQHVINATGILLHTNLGRAPLADRAIRRVQEATGFTNIELDLASGKRNKRGRRAMDLLARLTGAEDALVVNNCAAATMLVLRATALGKEVIISRGQLVEIGGGFRLPNVFEASGVKLREVGTTNRSYVRDYESVISEETGAILRVHHSNFRQTGFVTEPSIAELIACERPSEIPVIDDVGSGCVYDLGPFGIDEPNVLESVAAGADLVLFSGDKLFGGPQCGIIVGKQHWIDVLKTNPMMRALRVDKMTLSAVEATAEIHLEGGGAKELPLLWMLSREAEEVKAACENVVAQLPSKPNLKIDIVSSEAQVGGGSVPGCGIASYAIQIQGCDVNRLAESLRNGETSIQPRVVNDSVCLDLRTVADAELKSLTRSLCQALEKFE